MNKFEKVANGALYRLLRIVTLGMEKMQNNCKRTESTNNFLPIQASQFIENKGKNKAP